MLTEPTGPTQAEAATEPEPQAPPVAAAEPAAAQPNDPADIAGLLDAATDARLEGNEKEADRLDALLKSRTSEPPQGEEPTDLAAANEDTTEDEEAGDETPEVPTGDQPPAPDGKLPDRIRINHLSEEDKAAQNAINALTRGGMTLKDATARVLGAAQAEPEPEPEAEAEPEAEQTTSPAVAELETTVQDLETQLDDLGANEGLVTPEIMDLLKRHGRASAKLETAKLAAEMREADTSRAAQSFEAQRNAVFTDTVKKFPTMGDKQSEHWQLASDLALAAQNPQHRDHAKSLSVEAPEYFATKAAKVLGIQPATGTAPAKAKATPPPASPTAQPPATRPASGTRGSAPPAAQKSAAERAAALEAETDAILEGRASSPRRSMLRGGVFVR